MAACRNCVFLCARGFLRELYSMQVRYTASFRRGLFCCLYFVCYSSSGIQLQELSIMLVVYSILMLCIDHLITFEDLRDASLLQNHQPKRGIFKLKPPFLLLKFLKPMPSVGKVSFVSSVTACTVAFLKSCMKRWYFDLKLDHLEKHFLHEMKNCSASSRETN